MNPSSSSSHCGCIIPAQIQTLVTWCSKNGIWIHEKLQLLPQNGGIAVFSSEEVIPPSATLVKIPKSSVLSTKSTAVSHMMSASPYGLEAQLELAVALYLELAKKESSRWYGYLQSLPNRVDLPVFWDVPSKDDIYEDGGTAINWLEGTEVNRRLRYPSEKEENIPSVIKSFYDNTAVPVFLKCFGTSLEPQLHEFHHAYSLVSSRAFLVDAYHGLSMVPIADAFNHTTDNHVHLESEFQVCPECGSLRECPHDQDIVTSLPQDNSTSGYRHESNMEEDDYYEMVSNSAIPPHSEVFNTYGETLSNAQLLVQYGFVLDVNENDHITWSLEEAYHEVTRTLNYAHRVNVPTVESVRAIWLQAEGDLEVLRQHFEGQSQLIYCNTVATLDLARHNAGMDRDAFCINSDGRVSHQLWLFCALFRSLVRLNDGADGKATLVALVYQMAEVQRKVEDYMEGQDEEIELDADGLGSDIPNKVWSLVAETASMVLLLCRSRRGEIGPKGTDMSTTDLGDVLDKLPGNKPRTKLAVTHVITEVSMLNSCEANWSEFHDLSVSISSRE
ncbi:hypothetical protein VKT23_018115 [Stygiomarasmius scandens]|uniref:SET domain-containing protein n=1 Tax=Marasmiellus scandens TaxID=2682957 RepID=A0ABR1IPY6_9AGAR